MKLRIFIVVLILPVISALGVSGREGKADSSDRPMQSPEKPRRVLTNADFGAPPEGARRETPPPTASETPAPSYDSKRKARIQHFRKRAEAMQITLSTLETQIEFLRKRVEEIKAESRPVWRSEAKAGRKYLSYRGGDLLTPLPTEEELQVPSKLKELEAQLEKTLVRWDELAEEIRKAGFTVREVLSDE